MFLKNISYKEQNDGPGGQQTWQVDDLALGQINLIVGKNSSGKSRIANLISNLSRLVSGKILPKYNSGIWNVEFERMKGEAKEPQFYYLEVKNRLIAREQFKIKNQKIMERSESGQGFVIRKSNSERVEYKVPNDQLMAVLRRDEIQHPFFNHLYEWGESLCLYRFGSDFGKANVAIFDAPYSPHENFAMSDQVDQSAHVFKTTLARFEEPYREMILSDLREVGYNCEAVLLTPLTGISLGGPPPIVLSVKEADLNCLTGQYEMSQGMYRVLALSIQINANILWTQSRMVGRTPKIGDSPMIVIDDIGEGLDFSRSKQLINLLMKKALDNNIQIVMSSNDRFVMNDVPLEYWTVLNRVGGNVQAFNYQNSKALFDEFQYLGLNNFDFFSGNYFLPDEKK